MKTFTLNNSDFKNYIQKLRENNYIFTANEELQEISSYLSNIINYRRKDVVSDMSLNNIVIFLLMPQLNSSDILIESTEEAITEFLMPGWQDERKCISIYLNVNIMKLHSDMQKIKNYLLFV